MTELSRLRLLLEPCQSVEELDNYCIGFFNLELPWDTVDERSTSAPLMFLWDVYQTFLTGKGATRHVLAAARNTTKTLTSALIQYFSLVHFRRDSVHLASILDQSTTAIAYIDNFLSIPELVPYRSIDNARTKRLVNIPPNDFTSKTDAKLRVVTATKKGANSPRASTITLDEVDLVHKSILSEVAYVADPTRCGHRFDPVFIYLSSRKTNDGPIQTLIDEAEGPKGRDGTIRLHKWSAVDFMERCPPEVHKPDEPRVQAYLNTESLKVVWGKDQFDLAVGEAGKSAYKEIDAYEGCRTCPAFIACQARAPQQRSASPILRTIKFTGSILDAVADPAVIIAQSLNWKPETTGLVFKTFSYNQHVKSPIEFYEWVAGKKFNPDNLSDEELQRIIYSEVDGEFDDDAGGSLKDIQSLTPTKIDIYEAMLKAGWKIHYGVDYGYSPDPATVVIVGYHPKTKRACVLHTEATNPRVKPMDNKSWSQYVSQTVWPQMPGDVVAPDLADKAAPSYFGQFNIPCLQKKPHLIETGVSQLRGLMWNPITQTANFAILLTGEGDQNEMVINEMSHWTHAKTPTGWDFSKFDEDSNNHTIDAIRYALDPFVKDLQVRMNAKQIQPETIHTTREFLEANEATRQKYKDQDVKKQFQNFMLQEHGLSDIFSGERKLAMLRETEEANKRMRMTQRQVAEEKAAAEVAAQSEKPEPPKKTKLKYSF